MEDSGDDNRGVASQTLVGGQASPTKHSTLFIIAQKANDPMMHGLANIRCCIITAYVTSYITTSLLIAPIITYQWKYFCRASSHVPRLYSNKFVHNPVELHCECFSTNTMCHSYLRQPQSVLQS